MKRVWRFNLSFDGEQTVQMPLGARLLSVINQFEKLVLYALVDPEAATLEDVMIRVKCTGNEVQFHGQHFLGTVAFGSGTFIVHVWGSR